MNAILPLRRVALVTGGSRGLGRSTVLALADRGVDSIFTYQSRVADAEAVVAAVRQKGRNAVALRLDVGDPSSFPAFTQAVAGALAGMDAEGLDYLVNNAGTSLHKTFEQTTEAELDAAYNVHFKGTYLLTQALLSRLNNGGGIVNISSGLTRFVGAPTSAYAAMKGAIEVLTRYLAKELGPRRITVNTVAPGPVATDFSGGVVRDNPELQKRVIDMTSLGRVGQPDDIGDMIASLLDEANRWVTGQRIEVSGGVAL